MRRVLLIACVLVDPGCGEEEKPAPQPPPDLLPEVAGRANGWLRGDLHMHTTHSDGSDSVAVVVSLGEYLEDARFLEQNPSYRGNHLDFMAITDHRTVTALADPAFTSERLLLVPGEEFGTTGHANVFGLETHIPHDPGGDGVSQTDVESAVENAHAQGALFSPNHPMSQDNPWRWDTRELDSLEVWNAGWSLASPATTAADVAAWEANYGPASPFFRRATNPQDSGASVQALVMYEALLARGIHVAVVGGSDRHSIFMPGFPTTYVRGASADLAGLLDGIARRHSFVTRTPVSVQLTAEILVDGTGYELGDEPPVPAGGADVVLRFHLARADGALLRVIGGGPVAGDAELATAELGRVLHEQEVHGDPAVVELAVTATPGDWLYPMVLEPLIAPGLDAEQAERVRVKAAAIAASGGEPSDLVNVFIDLMDDALIEPERCEPALWSADMPQCVLADRDLPGTYFFPDLWDRAMNVEYTGGEITDYCVGAVGSAVLFVQE